MFDFITFPSFPKFSPYSFWMWFLMRILFAGKQKKMQGGRTALIRALANGQLDVVNRLLDCKEIDVNVQERVCGNV